MIIYDEYDFKLVEDNFCDILDKVREKQKDVGIVASNEEIVKVEKIILQFVKDKKRKLYGGYAINLLIKDKNSDDAIYKDPIYLNDSIPDIDFYSPEPIKDMVELCNLLADAKIESVRGAEAIHEETYNIYANEINYSQISYCPQHIFNMIETINIKGIYVINPIMYMTDFHRMLTDPLLSFRLIEKQFKRFTILNKYYPWKEYNANINMPKNDKTKEYINQILSMVEKTNMILIGTYAYNFFISKSNTDYKPIEIPFLEIISSNYKEDANKIINTLKDIKYVEHYPFFQYLGNCVKIYYKDSLICIIYDNNKRCHPYLKYDNYCIGTFSLTILYLLADALYLNVNKQTEMKEICYTMITNLFSARKKYFVKNKKNIFDETVFKEFVIDCIGKTITPSKEKELSIKEKKKKGEKYAAKYTPSTDRNKDMEGYHFANTSGNPINNEKNLKLK